VRLSCRFFETFSYLPPLTDDQIAKQVDYIIRSGWTPCLEFSNAENAYVKDIANIRFTGGSASCNYYDNRCATSPSLPGCPKRVSELMWEPPYFINLFNGL
jgi:ribulose-bisphosphate carboxylase small chain